MKRVILSAAIAAAALSVAPASADPTVERCGITPRYPCGVCVDEQTCVRLADLVQGG